MARNPFVYIVGPRPGENDGDAGAGKIPASLFAIRLFIGIVHHLYLAMDASVCSAVVFFFFLTRKLPTGYFVNFARKGAKYAKEIREFCADFWKRLLSI